MSGATSAAHPRAPVAKGAAGGVLRGTLRTSPASPPVYPRARMNRRIPLLAPLLLALPGAAIAQTPAGTGTAAGLGQAAVTEARRADAVLWNPALVGIYDGPLQTAQLLSVDVDRIPDGGWLTGTAALGALSGSASDPFAREYAFVPAGQGGDRISARVVWGAVQSHDLALSVSTHLLQEGSLPAGLRAALTGEMTPGGSAAGLSAAPAPPYLAAAPESDEAPLGETRRAVVSVAALSRGWYLGSYPALGQLWLGGTAKVWLAHGFAGGRFLADLPRHEVYDEISVRDAPGVGLDVGLAGRIAGVVRYGVSLANVYEASFTPSRSPRVRTVSVRGGAGGYVVEESFGPEQPAGEEGAHSERTRRLWDEAIFPAVLRAGASVDTPVGSWSAAYARTLRGGGLAERLRAPYTLAWRGTGRLPVRVSHGFGAEEEVTAVGLGLGPCDRQLVVSGERHAGEGGTGYGASVSFTVADRSCRMR